MNDSPVSPPIWSLAHRVRLALDEPVVMGILNVTPDSFSDGGAHNDVRRAVDGAIEMQREGARIIDIGGESTRPGAERISEEEQISRTRPVIERLVGDGFDGIISIDTTRASVAREALDAGVHIVNDVSAGEEDGAMFPLIAEHGAGVILMHRRLPPTEDSYSDRYDSEPVFEGGVVESVRGYLADRARVAMDAGIDSSAIAIDPGLGFGKSVEQNLELVSEIGVFLDSGFPVLSAASRKSFIGKITEIGRAHV